MLDIADDGSTPALRDAQTFSTRADRDRLTAPALKAYWRDAQNWRLDNEEAARLLDVSDSTWSRIKVGSWSGTLGQDQLTRVSAVVGMYEGLRRHFADDMAIRWPRLRNRASPFCGLSALEAMIDGGIPLMIDARRHVDAMRNGL